MIVVVAAITEAQIRIGSRKQPAACRNGKGGTHLLQELLLEALGIKLQDKKSEKGQKDLNGEKGTKDKRSEKCRRDQKC
jgi:hypothetical protein